MEIKNVIGFEGLYIITDSGINEETIFSIRRNCYIKPHVKNGYLYVNLCKNGKYYSFLLHRLIGFHFIKKPEHLKNIRFDKLQIDHISTNKIDNSISNLRWCTPKENSNNPISFEHRCNAQQNSQYVKSRKLVVQQLTKDGELINIYESVCDCQKQGYNKGHVAACCRGEEKTYKGYIWKYADYQ